MKLISILDETDLKIIELIMENLKPREIAHKLWKDPGYIRVKIFRLRKHFNAYSTEHLIEILSSESTAA